MGGSREGEVKLSSAKSIGEEGGEESCSLVGEKEEVGVREKAKGDEARSGRRRELSSSSDSSLKKKNK